MTKLLVLALCVCLGMSTSVKERLEALNGSAESFEIGGMVCDPLSIGNGNCDWGCTFPEGQYDGGDCCSSEWLGDGTCDYLCNFEKTNWDGGDCPH